MKVLKALGLFLLLAVSARASVDPVSYQRLTLTATNATITAQNVYKQSFAVEIQGVTGTVQLKVEGSQDGATWNRLWFVNAGSQAQSMTITANGLYVGSCGAMRSIRVKAIVVTSGVADVGLGLGDGAPNTLLTGAASGSAGGSSSNPAAVTLYDPSGNAIYSIGTPVATPTTFNKTADGYCSRCTTTYDSNFILPTRPNSVVTLGNLSPTATDAYVYLTPSGLTNVYLDNFGTGAGTVWYQVTNSSTAVNPTNNGHALLAGGSLSYLGIPGTYFHYANPNVLTVTGGTADVLLPYMAGTTLPQTAPYIP